MAKASVSGLRVYLHTGNEPDEYLTVAGARDLVAELEKAAKDVEKAAGALMRSEERALDEARGIATAGEMEGSKAKPKSKIDTPDDRQVSKTKAKAATGKPKRQASSRRKAAK